MIVNASSRPSGEVLRVETLSAKRPAWCCCWLSPRSAMRRPSRWEPGSRASRDYPDRPAYQQRRWDAFRLAPPPCALPGALATSAPNLMPSHRFLMTTTSSRTISSASKACGLIYTPACASGGILHGAVRTGVEVFYTPQLEWFARYSQFNTINHYAGANLAGVFGRTTAELHYQSAFYTERTSCKPPGTRRTPKA